MSSVLRSRPLRWGILGLGISGLHHLQRLMLEESCQVLAVADPAPRALENGLGWGTRLHADVEPILAADDIDVVMIATPPATHASLACRMLAAGKHVVVESPLALTSADLSAIEEEAERTNRTVSVVALHRWDGEFRTACDLVRSGMLGELRQIRRIARQFVPQFPGQGRGSFDELGAPFVDQILQLTDQTVCSVTCRCFASPQNSAGGDGFILRLELTNDVSAEVESSYGSLAALQTGWVLDGSMGGYSGGRHYRAGEDGEVIDVPVTPLPSQPDLFYAHLLENLARPEVTTETLATAGRVIAVLEAARQAAESGKRIDVQI